MRSVMLGTLLPCALGTWGPGDLVFERETWLMTEAAECFGGQSVNTLQEWGDKAAYVDDLPTGVIDQPSPEAESSSHGIADQSVFARAIETNVSREVLQMAVPKPARRCNDKPLITENKDSGTVIAFLNAITIANVGRLVLVYMSSVTEPQRYVSPDSTSSPLGPFGKIKSAHEWLMADAAFASQELFAAQMYLRIFGYDTFPTSANTATLSVVPFIIDCIRLDQPLAVYGARHETPDGNYVREDKFVEEVRNGLETTHDCLHSSFSLPQVIDVARGEPVGALEIVNRPRGCAESFTECAESADDDPTPATISSSEGRQILRRPPRLGLADSVMSRLVLIGLPC